MRRLFPPGLRLFAPLSLGVEPGYGFRVGMVSGSAKLPKCEAARQFEERVYPGTAGVSDRKVICVKGTADTYSWVEQIPLSQGPTGPTGSTGPTGVASPVISAQTKTIASGAVTLDAIAASVSIILLTLDTEAAAASDDLDTINVTGSVTDGTTLFVRSTNNARDVVCKHNTGNLVHRPASDFTLATNNDTSMYRRSSTSWVQVARAT